MLVTTQSAINVGLSLQKISVEAVATRGVPRLIIVGMPTKTIVEARERTTTALRNLKVKTIRQRVVINLAPANSVKYAPHLDLAIAISLLQLTRTIPKQSSTTLWLGELGLDGHLKPVLGLFNLVYLAKSAGFTEVVFPASQAHELASFRQIKLRPMYSLAEIVAPATNALTFKAKIPPTLVKQVPSWKPVLGQATNKRMLLIALAGQHHTLLTGPPGAGKSELAQAAPSFLPPLTIPDAQLVTRLHSLCAAPNTKFNRTAPVRLVNQTATNRTLLGNHLFPGELSLAQHGVLILDELPEFRASVLESLREPMQSQQVRFHYQGRVVSHPAECLIIATANPCQCGFAGTTLKTCTCLPQQRQRYNLRISGAVRDRFALWLRIQSEGGSQLLSTQDEKQAEIETARQAEQVKKTKVYLNAIPRKLEILQPRLTKKAAVILSKAINRYSLSARKSIMMISVALTIAVWENQEVISDQHLLEALQYRPESDTIA